MFIVYFHKHPLCQCVKRKTLATGFGYGALTPPFRNRLGGRRVLLKMGMLPWSHYYNLILTILCV